VKCAVLAEIERLNAAVGSVVWGPPLMVLLIGTGGLGQKWLVAVVEEKQSGLRSGFMDQ
jgi:hypothetical protein